MHNPLGGTTPGTASPRGRRTGTLAGIVALLCAGLSLGWGKSPDTRKPPPPGVTPPARPTALVELTVPAGVKVSLDGTKLTENAAKGEVVTEGEATLRLSNHMTLQAHGARVTVSIPGRRQGARVVIEPMPTTVARK